MESEAELRAELERINACLASMEPEYERLRARRRELEALFPVPEPKWSTPRPRPSCVIG